MKGQPGFTLSKQCSSIPWNALFIARRIKPMSQISFNAKALGIAIHTQRGDVRHALAGRTPKSFMVVRPGIEAIIEGLRLANIKGFEVPGNKLSTRDVDT